MRPGILGLILLSLAACGTRSIAAGSSFGWLVGRIADRDTGQTIPCRLYLKGADGKLYFPEVGEEGSVVIYDKGDGNGERHATINPGLFRASLPAGPAVVTIERGKEYIPLSGKALIQEGQETRKTFRLKRWTNMAERGWYSGDTHVHRKPSNLPNIMLAEDLNVSFPLIAWAHRAYTRPDDFSDAAFTPKLTKGLYEIDGTHVICGTNTEYEIFSVGERRWTLGAFMILNHRKTFEAGVPPVGKVAAEARSQGALLDLDKHNWPWSMMLVPVANIDLYELSNNHMWRIHPRFITWGEPAPEFMNVTPDPKGWATYGFRMYYALLNCGFRLKPSAGTASGVHPVPLGYSRVYAKVDGKFTFDKWMESLAKGRSFVTTGPMLFLTVNGFDPGAELRFPTTGGSKVRITVVVEYARPVEKVEIIVNGTVHRRFDLNPDLPADEGHRATFEADLVPERSSWIAARCFEKEIPGNVSFAHTGPVYVMLGQQPITPRKQEAAYLVNRLKDEIERNRQILNPDALAEYETALNVYQEIERKAE